MDGREGVLLKVDGDWEIRFERRLRHSPEQVWAAITAPGAMSRWFDETAMPNPLAVGAAIRFTHKAVGMESRGEITALDPPRLIEWLWIGGFGPASRMRWEIEPDGEGSRLIMRQQVADPPVTARSMAGWHKCLDRMQAMLDGGEEKPDFAAWLKLFEETYKPKVLEAGLTAPQVGAPQSATRS
jgi:uncharacterized protein YndB with AHSA1/START domain